VIHVVAVVIVLAARPGQKIPMVAIPDLSKGAVAYNSLNTSGVPSHYLKSGQGPEPWRRFVNADGSISRRGAGGGKYWGPVGERG
jgi:hypothetical protein